MANISIEKLRKLYELMVSIEEIRDMYLKYKDDCTLVENAKKKYGKTIEDVLNPERIKIFKEIQEIDGITEEDEVEHIPKEGEEVRVVVSSEDKEFVSGCVKPQKTAAIFSKKYIQEKCLGRDEDYIEELIRELGEEEDFISIGDGSLLVVIDKIKGEIAEADGFAPGFIKEAKIETIADRLKTFINEKYNYNINKNKLEELAQTVKDKIVGGS